MKRIVAVGGASLLLLLLVAGCNLFSFTAPTSSSSDYVYEGRQHLWDGEYEDAVESFTKAIEENPNNPKARWGRAKAKLRSTGHTAMSLVSAISTFASGPGADLPFFSWPKDSASALYEALFMVRDDLTAIYSGEASDEEFRMETFTDTLAIPPVTRTAVKVVALDYVAVYTIHGILMLRDVNRDSVINDEDFDITFFFNALENLSLDNLPDWSSMSQEERDAIVDNVQNLLNTGSDVIVEVLNNMDNVGVNTSQINEVATDVAGGLEAWRQPPYPHGP